MRFAGQTRSGITITGFQRSKPGKKGLGVAYPLSSTGFSSATKADPIWREVCGAGGRIRRKGGRGFFRPKVFCVNPDTYLA